MSFSFLFLFLLFSDNSTSLNSQVFFHYLLASLVDQMVKEPTCNPGEGNGNPLQHSCLEKPMDRGAWWATVHGVTKSRTRLNDFTRICIIFHRQQFIMFKLILIFIYGLDLKYKNQERKIANNSRSLEKGDLLKS